MGDGKRLISADEVAAILGVSAAWVRDHATRKQPRLPAIKLGKLWRFRESDIHAFLDRIATEHKW
jgi:excisionase family DNA binding protein